MAGVNDPMMAEVMNLLEAEPDSSSHAPASVITAVAPLLAEQAPGIPAHREQLTILVSTDKAKQAIGVKLTQELVKRLDAKDVEKYIKRYETYVGAKTTETLLESFLALTMKALGSIVRLKDADGLLNDLKNDYIFTKELSALAGDLALRCGRMLVVANAMLITTKYIDFSAEP